MSKDKSYLTLPSWLKYHCDIKKDEHTWEAYDGDKWHVFRFSGFELLTEGEWLEFRLRVIHDKYYGITALSTPRMTVY